MKATLAALRLVSPHTAALLALDPRRAAQRARFLLSLKGGCDDRVRGALERIARGA